MTTKMTRYTDLKLMLHHWQDIMVDDCRGYALFFVVSLMFALPSCKNKKAEQIGENEFYVCSMDPQIMEKQPGPCPICKMPLTKTIIDKSQMQFIKLNDEQMELGNIKVDSVRSSFISRENTLTGTFGINQNKTEQVSAKINGRIDQLYYKILGEQVNEGDKLYDLYSRELLLAQEEYLLVFEKSKLLNEGGKVILTSAKNKLLLWGLNEQQIKELETTKQTKITNTIYSKISGVITEISLKEGDYVNEGTKIYKLADLSSLWVEAQLYSNELGYLLEGGMVDIIAEAYPDERIKGNIFFINPELQEQSKINLVRVEVDNSRHLYKPGMQAYVILKSDQKKSIVLPMNAVLQNAKENVVWVQIEKGKFEARAVTIGIQNKDKIEITSGLKAGDFVVVSGAYLLNSEYVFKRGVTPMDINMDKNHDMKM
jgi:Cu(I)/Ag(I) efflux system membrane fusion protein